VNRAIEIPNPLLLALIPEGSELRIEKANSHNLNWTWRVTYRNGITGEGVTKVGAWLHDTLQSVVKGIES